MTRRGFLGRLLYAGVIARAAALTSLAPSPSFVDMEHATYKFWRNQQTSPSTAFDGLRHTMREVYTQCSVVEPS